MIEDVSNVPLVAGVFIKYSMENDSMMAASSACRRPRCERDAHARAAHARAARPAGLRAHAQGAHVARVRRRERAAMGGDGEGTVLGRRRGRARGAHCRRASS